MKDSKEEPAERLLNAGVLGLKVDQVLKTLTDLECQIIKLRYGLEDGYSHSLEEVGRSLKITPELVQAIEAKAVAKLRR